LEDALGRLAEELLVNKQPPPDEDFFAEEIELQADTKLQRRRGRICRVVEGAGHATIQYSGGRITGPAKIAQALKYVAEHRSFAIRSLPGDLSDREKIVLARRLVREGLLEAKDANE
jgi:hypothetical protein